MNISLQKVPLISVIIPLYNKALYIKRALDSVLSQTLQDFEVIVVNDGSKDGGENIVEEYGDSRIHLINQENRGVSAARNHGVNAARAELVAFLDADDRWHPEFLETICKLWMKYPNAGLYGTNRTIVHLTSSIRSEIPIRCYDICEGWEGVIQSYFRTSALGPHPLCTSSIAIPKNVFTKIHGFREDLRYYEDLDIYARIALNYDIAYCSKYLVEYIKDDENAATSNVSLIPAVHPIITSIDDLISNNKLSPEIKTKPDIALYLDSLNISQASNRLPKDKINARRYLKAITHDELKCRKRLLYISSYVPERIYSSISAIYGTVKKKQICK